MFAIAVRKLPYRPVIDEAPAWPGEKRRTSLAEGTTLPPQWKYEGIAVLLHAAALALACKGFRGRTWEWLPLLLA